MEVGDRYVDVPVVWQWLVSAPWIFFCSGPGDATGPIGPRGRSANEGANANVSQNFCHTKKGTCISCVFAREILDSAVEIRSDVWAASSSDARCSSCVD